MSVKFRIPHFSYELASSSNIHFKHTVDGKEQICYVGSVSDFYKTLGYTDSMAKAGTAPEEFVWEAYLKDSSFSVCLQKHIADYLNTHSSIFKVLYGEQYAAYATNHASAREARGSACVACKLRDVCSNDARC